MITEQLIRHNQARHQELLREAAQSRIGQEVARKVAQKADGPSLLSKALARTGDLLVAAGQGLQRRYRRMEQGVNGAEYVNSQRLGRAL